MNVPSVITAAVEFVGAILVHLNVVESPKFVQSQRSAERTGSGDAGSTTPAVAEPDAARRLLLFCVSTMFTTACLKLQQTIFALFAIKEFGLDTIDIGFIFLLAALATIVATRLVIPLNKSIGPYNSGIASSLIHALSILLLTVCPLLASASSPHLKRAGFICMVTCFATASAAATLANTFQSIISGELQDQPTVQGRGFQFRQGGQIIVPIVGSYLFNINSAYPWLFGALLASAAAIPCHMLKPRLTTLVDEPLTPFGDAWREDQLTRKDIVELGEFMADLLQKKHLKWSSHKEQVQGLLERSIPEMPIHSREDYYEALVQFSTA